jgi:hypothetical protein
VYPSRQEHYGLCSCLLERSIPVTRSVWPWVRRMPAGVTRPLTLRAAGIARVGREHSRDGGFYSGHGRWRWCRGCSARGRGEGTGRVSGYVEARLVFDTKSVPGAIPHVKLEPGGEGGGHEQQVSSHYQSTTYCRRTFGYYPQRAAAIRAVVVLEVGWASPVGGHGANDDQALLRHSLNAVNLLDTRPCHDHSCVTVDGPQPTIVEIV